MLDAFKCFCVPKWQCFCLEDGPSSRKKAWRIPKPIRAGGLKPAGEGGPSPAGGVRKIGVCASGERIDRLGGWCFGTPSRAIPRAGKKGATVAERFPGVALSVRRPHPEIKLGVAERRAARFSYVYTSVSLP